VTSGATKESTKNQRRPYQIHHPRTKDTRKGKKAAEGGGGESQGVAKRLGGKAALQRRLATGRAQGRPTCISQG